MFWVLLALINDLKYKNWIYAKFRIRFYLIGEMFKTFYRFTGPTCLLTNLRIWVAFCLGSLSPSLPKWGSHHTFGQGYFDSRPTPNGIFLWKPILGKHFFGSRQLKVAEICGRKINKNVKPQTFKNGHKSHVQKNAIFAPIVANGLPGNKKSFPY